MRRSTFPMIAVGVLAAQGCANHEEDLSARTSRTSGFFLVRRPTDPCTADDGATCRGFVASAVNSSTTQCADGSASPACAVTAIDLTGAGLPEGQVASLLRDITSSVDAPTVLLRGRMVVRDGASVLVADEAWQAPDAAPVRGAFHLVTAAGSSCTYLPCASVLDHRVNAALEPEAIAGVDVSALRAVDDATRDALLGEATSDAGLLVAGTQSYRADGRVLRAEQVFTRVRPERAPTQCAQELRATLDDATQRLLYPSQTDAPFRAVTTAASAQAMSDLARTMGHGEAVRTESFDAFMRPLTDATASPSDQLRAARFRTLERTLRAQLHDLTVYRVGTVDVRVFVLGVTACGEVAGLETTALER